MPKYCFGIRFTKSTKVSKIGRKTAKIQTEEKFNFLTKNLNIFGKI